MNNGLDTILQIFTLAFTGGVLVILLGALLVVAKKGKLYYVCKYLTAIVSAGCSGIATAILNMINKLSTQENIITFITIYGIIMLCLLQYIKDNQKEQHNG
ncbi:MAG: hypothetical protein DRO40_11480 [Thermoprotei archaeon]|nr:MAG: hypothetical protein DRO40_11480 [Thermoprotei archaeon]